MSSEYNFDRLQAVRWIVISKPIESRHAHLRPLPFHGLTHIEKLCTFNLCLAEIEYLSHQIVETKAELCSLVCTNIETWCDTRRFSADMIQVHQRLERVEFRFNEDGHSGFASIHNVSQLKQDLPLVKLFSLTSIRDDEMIEQRDILTSMETMENDRDEVYYQHEIDKIDQKRNLLLAFWHNLEKVLIEKYKFISDLSGLEKFEFGSCFSWTPEIWRECFGKVISKSPGLESLSLHGWDQLGKLAKMGSRSSTIQPIRADAEKAIAECFAMMPNLTRLQLVDFSIGSGLLGNHVSKSIGHLEIEYTRTFPSFFIEPADIWLLVGPIKEFIASVFSCDCEKSRTVIIRLDPRLLKEIESSPFFIEEPFLESIQITLKDKNVNIKLLESKSN